MDFLGWIILFFTCVIAEQKQPLNNFISHYEGLSYNTQTIHNNHVRNKRSLDPTNSAVRVTFNAHGRTFQLRLERDTSTFLPDAESIEADGSTRPLDVSHIYRGILEGEPSSHVHGSIIDGVFSGRIETERSGTFYVDKSELYFPQMMPFHSVIYHDTHVIHPHSNRDKRSAEGSSSTDGNKLIEDDANMPRVGCGLSSSDVHEWMEKVQNSAVPTTAEKPSSGRPRHDFRNRYQPQTQKESPLKTSKMKRSSNGSNQNRMCALFLQSDPMLWDYMTRSPSEKTGGLGYSHERAREEITSLFASHVDGIKKIYSNTIFKYQDIGPFTGFTFAVHRVQINSSSECEHPNDNPFCKTNVDVSNFLNLNSLSNHDLYCLAYVFTYRDFSQGTLGLAWVGSYLRSSGGLCERWKQYTENQRMIYKSLNTGIVTLVNYGSRVPPKVSTLTFAHEVGHNFGSPHDGGETCVPSLNNPNNLNGNFIMFASATSGDKPNNHEFSSCSIGNITLVLDAVLNEQNGKDNCFSQSQEAFCGNRIVEGDEECDCGFSTDCRNDVHSDLCCYEQESPKHCKRRENATCSPSEGPCCTGPRCSFTPLLPQAVCLQEKECSQVSYCTGLSAKCPHPSPKPDFTLCNSKTQICKKGDCAGSVCEKVNWTMCSMEAPKDDKSFDRGQLCYVSCLNPKTGKCISTGNIKDVYKMENKKLLELLEIVDMMDTGIQLPAGAPCDNYRGYCDVFQKCRAVNEDGPLARLMNIVFNKQTISDIKTWIVKNWWAVGLMFLGLIVFMALFIKCCAVHTPSSNPRQPPARKLTLPRRHIQRPQPINPSTHIPLGPPPPYTPTPDHTRIQPQQGKRRAPASSSRRNQGRPEAGRSRPNHSRYDIEIKHHRGRKS